MENATEIRLSLDAKAELLTMSYMNSLDLSGKTPAEVVDLYEKALAEIHEVLLKKQVTKMNEINKALFEQF